MHKILGYNGTRCFSLHFCGDCCNENHENTGCMQIRHSMQQRQMVRMSYEHAIVSNYIVTMIAAFYSTSLRHENASGYYRVSSFFLAKILTDLIPARIIPLLFYCAISYFMIGKSYKLLYVFDVKSLYVIQAWKKKCKSFLFFY